MEGLRTWVDSRPEAVFLVQPIAGEAIEFSWREVADQSLALAGYLQSLGYEPGSRIALASKNCAYSIIAELAIWRAGYVSVPIYPSLTGESVRYILEHSEAQAIFIGALDDAESMCGGIPTSMPKITFPTLEPEQRPDALSWESALGQGLDIDPSRPTDPSGLARLIYTSGSTGKPKGVMISFEAMAAASDILLNLAEVSEDDRMLSYLPLAHVFEAAVVLVSSFRFGFQVYFSEGLETFTADLKRARPTLFHSVPRLWVKFQQAVQQKIGQARLDAALSNPDSAAATRAQVLESLGLQHARVAITGSAPLAPSVMQWYRALGLELLEGYGMSEDFAHSHCSRPGQSRIGYVGPPNRGVLGRISPEGEIQVKSPARMLGYFKDEEKTREAFTEDGWFRTGDLGHYDDEGSLRITGRLKELFKTSKGKYVAPAPIENKLCHPCIETVCVTGANFPQPHALLMPSDSARQLAGSEAGKAQLQGEFQQLIDTINAGLDPHEQLAFAVVVETPWTIANGLLTPTLKIKRSELEARYAEQAQDWYRRGEKVIWLSE